MLFQSDTQTTICSLYDRAKLAEKNQYEVFFGGNHARVDIQTTADTGRTLLLLKDVYKRQFQSIIDSMDLGSVFNPRNSASNLICRYVRAMQNSESSSQIETLYKLSLIHIYSRP